MAIEGVFLKRPADIFYKYLAHLQKWRLKLKCADQEQLDSWMVKTKSWLEKLEEKLRERAPVDPFI
jgi:hypothetical protein